MSSVCGCSSAAPGASPSRRPAACSCPRPATPWPPPGAPRISVASRPAAGPASSGFASPNLRQHHLGEQEQVLALPAGHALARQTQIPLRALQGQPLLLISPEFNPNYGQRLLGLCAQHNVQPQVNYAADDLFTLIWLVSAGLGLCPYPSSLTETAPRGVVFRPLRPRLNRIELALMWPTAADSAPLLALIEQLKG